MAGTIGNMTEADLNRFIQAVLKTQGPNLPLGQTLKTVNITEGVALTDKAANSLGRFFLQLANSGTQRNVDFGTATLVFPGGSPGSSNATVTHSIGAIPIAVVCTANSAPTTSKEIVLRATGLSTTSFIVSGTSVDGVAQSGNTSFYWIAIG